MRFESTRWFLALAVALVLAESGCFAERCGCAPAPMCDHGCQNSCGCCGCEPGARWVTEAGVLLCTGTCYVYDTLDAGD